MARDAVGATGGVNGNQFGTWKASREQREGVLG